MWTRNSSWHSITPSSGHHRRGASPYIEPSYSNTDSSYPRLSIYTCNLAEVAGRSDLGRALPRRRNATDCNGKEKDWESGFHYYGARYYWSEVLTSWLSVDPMADKYPSMSPYSYCAWNPVKLVDPDGCEVVDDWYKDKNGYVQWDANVHSQNDLKNGEEYLGKTVMMTAEGSDEVTYGDQYGHTWESVSLREVSITEKAPNPLVDRIHQSATDFWGHPVTEAVVDATLFVVTGGIDAVANGVGKAFIKHKAKSISVSQSSSNVSTTASHIREWLGEGRCKINKYGDPVFTSKDNLRKFRIDMNNTQGDKIHMHLERKTPNRNWKDATPTHRLYPKQ